MSHKVIITTDGTDRIEIEVSDEVYEIIKPDVSDFSIAEEDK